MKVLDHLNRPVPVSHESGKVMVTVPADNENVLLVLDDENAVKLAKDLLLKTGRKV